ncbi:MAG: tRNA pseudouridine(55) synthase TruB [Christensenellaceae bacterium]|nr:tRNA pseudouridine(55) synthase TruB [Christensenellaceae bacterium]MDD6926993.1 tRNA pseudouridine(55) synthase TruB [bacterium]MDY2850605.1 tRNA pseudouridine(55) synthase TruB [Christensenellaceae bacterium]
MKNGFINIYKNKCDGSTYVVNKTKKKIDYKCGHMGTLDPLASGVLPIGVGKATRLFDFLMDKKKVYLAEFTFGYETDSFDLEGKVVKTGGRVPEKNEIVAVLGDFIGEIDQVPPRFSAIMIDGKRGYDLARKGADFSLPAKKVVIDDFSLVRASGERSYIFKIECRGGTYIRSLCRDLADKLGTVATMTMLERTEVGVFKKEKSITLKELLASDNVEQYIIPPEDVLHFPEIVLDNTSAIRLLNGLKDEFPYQNGLYKVFNESEFWGVGEVSDKKIYMRAYVCE